MKKIILFILMFFLPLVTNAVTREQFQDAIVNVSMSAATTYADEFAYSFYWGGTPSNPVNVSETTTKVWLQNAYNGIKSSGNIYGSTSAQAGIHGSFKNKFGVFCESFVRLMMHHASGGVLDYYDDFERIKVNEIRRGDFIHFPGHIAIYVDDNNDNKASTYNVVEASSTVHYKLISNTADYGYRIKDSSLSKLNYNQVMASFDFHDRLDDYPPIINEVRQINDKILINATDYKKYELPERSDILEPENNGIVGYQITTSNIEPTEWKSITRSETIKNEYDGVTKKGTYYVWVIDVGGNVASKMLSATDYIEEKNEIGNLKYELIKSSEISIVIENALDSDGIKEYRYYLENNLVASSKESNYVFTNLNANTLYNVYYEIVDNKNNVYKSSNYQIKTQKSVTDFKLEKDVITIAIGETYKINSIVTSIDDNYVINYKDYDKSVILVDDNGNIKGINEGVTYINISIEDFIIVMKVTVVNDNSINENIPNENNNKNNGVNFLTIIMIILIVIIIGVIIKLIIDYRKKRIK